MNARDFFNALNDIDIRYLENAQPWAEPVVRKFPRARVAALAAGLVLCLGLGTLLLWKSPLLFAPAPAVQTDSWDVPELEFAVDSAGISYSVGISWSEDTVYRELTQAELEAFQHQPSLEWTQAYTLQGTALFAGDGMLCYLDVTGSSPESAGDGPIFRLELAEGSLPYPAKGLLLLEPNNHVSGVDVWGVQGAATEDTPTSYLAAFLLEGEPSLGVSVTAYGGGTRTEEDAKYLAELATAQILSQGVSLDALSLDYAQGDTQELANHPNPDALGPDVTTAQPMSGEEVSFLTGQGFLPEEFDFSSFQGTVIRDAQGNVYSLTLEGFFTEDEMSAFTLTLAPQEIPGSLAKARLDFLEEPNNQVGTTAVYAARYEEERGYSLSEGDPSSDSAQSVILSLAFLRERDAPLGVALEVSSDKWGFASEGEARSFAQQVAINLIAQGADLGDILESSPLRLEFAQGSRNTLMEYTRSFPPVEGGAQSAALTEEQLAALREQPGLAWLQDYYLSGSVLFEETEDVLQVVIAGFSPEEAGDTGGVVEILPREEGGQALSARLAFRLELRPGDMPYYTVSELGFLFDGYDPEDSTIANNHVNGVGVRAAVYQDYEWWELDEPQRESFAIFTEYDLNGLGVGLSLYGDGLHLSQEKGEFLAEQAAWEGIGQGISLDGLTPDPAASADPSPEEEIRLLAPSGDTVPTLEFAANTTGRELSTQ